MSRENPFNKLLNKRCIGVDDHVIYFENGISIEFNKYETYIDKFDKTKERRPKYYSPTYWEVTVVDKNTE